MTDAEAAQDMQLRLAAALAEAGEQLVLGTAVKLERHTRFTSRVTVLIDDAGARLAARAGIFWPTRAQAIQRGEGRQPQDPHHMLFADTLKAQVRALVVERLRGPGSTPDRFAPWLVRMSYGTQPAPPMTVRRLGNSECWCGCSTTYALMRAVARDPAGHTCDAVFELETHA